MSVHSSWDWLRGARPDDRGRAAGLPSGDEWWQVDWVAEAAVAEHVDIDALTPQEVDELALAAFPFYPRTRVEEE